MAASTNIQRRVAGPELLVVVGGCVFIAVLILSAVFEADIRWLHFFQAWMYVAAIVLTLQRNRYGYFIGIAVAGLWDYINLFVTTFLTNGVTELVKWIQTGHIPRPDQLISVPAWLANALVVIGAIWAYRRHVKDRRGDAIRFLVTLALTTAFFAADMALFQPRYLALFPQMFRPHVPFRR